MPALFLYNNHTMYSYCPYDTKKSLYPGIVRRYVRKNYNKINTIIRVTSKYSIFTKGAVFLEPSRMKFRLYSPAQKVVK